MNRLTTHCEPYTKVILLKKVQHRIWDRNLLWSNHLEKIIVRFVLISLWFYHVGHLGSLLVLSIHKSYNLVGVRPLKVIRAVLLDAWATWKTLEIIHQCPTVKQWNMTKIFKTTLVSQSSVFFLLVCIQLLQPSYPLPCKAKSQLEINW